MRRWIYEGDKRDVNETKTKDAKGAKRIEINSDIDVTVTGIDSSEVIARLYGYSYVGRIPRFIVERDGDEINISAQTPKETIRELFSGHFDLSDIATGRSEKLELEIQIPNTAFEQIFIKNDGCINRVCSVKAKSVVIENCTGANDVSNIEAHDIIVKNRVSDNIIKGCKATNQIILQNSIGKNHASSIKTKILSANGENILKSCEASVVEISDRNNSLDLIEADYISIKSIGGENKLSNSKANEVIMQNRIGRNILNSVEVKEKITLKGIMRKNELNSVSAALIEEVIS